MSSRVYLALGANVGRRRENLQRAVDELGEVLAIETISPLFETEPWGIVDQPDFINLCLAARTNLAPEALLSEAKAIERRLGRQEEQRWGPRLIDIDLIFYGNQVYAGDELTLPHPRFQERAFVLAPLVEIAANYRDPRSGRTVAEIAAEVNQDTVRRLIGPDFTLRKPIWFAWGVKTYIMGILNVTPDSFSGDGLARGGDFVAAAVRQAKKFVAGGADILDVGGESTRPGSQPISADEERGRVEQVITALRSVVDVPISVDTYKASVAETALAAGADWINDVWGLRMDSGMANLAAEAGCPLVLMHNRSKPKSVEQQDKLGGRYVGVQYDGLIADIKRELKQSVDEALAAGVSESRIVVDPGIGFGKTVSQNLQLLNELDAFEELGYPILLGSSRKSFIGYSLDLPPSQRVEGTAATIAIGIDRGADIVRVHDVEAMARVARMTDEIVRLNMT
ncbi:MAG: dihydropteroate synthase [Chloroflexota bacterium]|nr:MAG: dihydropteroate synthase [Chloroflexota bacterium]